MHLLTAARRFSLFALLLCACTASTDEGDDEALADDEALSGSPQNLDIGLNGAPDQFAYWPTYFGAETRSHGPKLCHTYIVWNIADEPATTPNAGADPGHRPWFEAWAPAAKSAGCEEALVSFKQQSPGAPPSERDYAAAVKKFLETSWGAPSKLVIAPWNEPNNGGPAGDGLGKPIEPELAAHYYLAVERLCKTHACRAVAGDFASNGNFWNDFEWRCAPGDVDARDPGKCKNPTPLAHGKGPSYLDRYKAVILDHADDYGLGKGFRPPVFAYHGWHDVNEYLDKADHCSTYETCATRRVLKNMGGSWAKEVWDTEVGVGQFDPGPDPHEQACAAAFLLRLHTKPSARITRVYITRLKGGPGTLFDGKTPREAMNVLAHRQTQVAGCK